MGWKVSRGERMSGHVSHPCPTCGEEVWGSCKPCLAEEYVRWKKIQRERRQRKREGKKNEC